MLSLMQECKFKPFYLLSSMHMEFALGGVYSLLLLLQEQLLK